MTRPFTFALIISLFGSTSCRDPSQSVPRASTRAAQPAPSVPDPQAQPGAQRIVLGPPNGSIGFVASKVTASHEGSFERFDGTLWFSPEHIEQSVVRIAIEMASVRIDPPRLRSHLLRADFFDVERFPHATFESTAIRSGGEGSATHTVTGRLTLHGVTRETSFPLHLAVTPARVSMRAEFSINRREFGIVYNGMADDLIRDGVVIRFDLHADRR